MASLSWTDAKNYVVTGFLGLWFLLVTKDVLDSPSTAQVEELLKRNAVVSVTKDEILEFVNKYARFNEDKYQIESKLLQTQYLITTLEKRQSELLMQVQENRGDRIEQVEQIREDIQENDRELQQIRENVTRIMALLEGIKQGK